MSAPHRNTRPDDLLDAPIEGEAPAPRRYPLMPLAVRIPEACRLSGIGRSKLYELIKAHEITIIKVGTITLVPIESLKTYLGI